MFRGIYQMTLDSKNRLSIPSKHRAAFALSQEDGAEVAQVILTVDLDRCLLMYPLDEWEKIEKRLVALSSMDPKSRSIKRLLMGHASECDLDGSGRILIPPPLREYADLKKKIVLVGQGNKFEMWDEDLWMAMRDDLLHQDHAVGLSAELEALSF